MCKQSFSGFFTSINIHGSSKYSHLATPDSVAPLTRPHSSKYHLDYLTGLIARWEAEDMVLPQYEKAEIQVSQCAFRSKQRRKSLPWDVFSVHNWKKVLTKIGSLVWGCGSPWQPGLHWAPDWGGSTQSWEQGQSAKEGTGTHGPGVQGCHQEGHSSRDWVKGSKKSF